MKTIEKIVYMTEKGQITLPMAWRRKVGTSVVRISVGAGDKLEIVPVESKQNDETGWITVFNKDRDNNGRGVTANRFLRELRTIKKEGSRKK